MRYRLLAVLALVLAACGGGTDPIDAPITGQWNAAQIDVLFNVRLHLNESGGGKLSGYWTGQMHNASGGFYTRSGEIASGTRSGPEITIFMAPSSPCGYGGYALDLTLTNSVSASGTLTYLDCDGGRAGYTLPVSISKN